MRLVEVLDISQKKIGQYLRWFGPHQFLLAENEHIKLHPPQLDKTATKNLLQKSRRRGVIEKVKDFIPGMTHFKRSPNG